MRVSSKAITSRRSPMEYFQGHVNLRHCWELRENLLDSMTNNHLVPTDVLNGHGDFAIDADPFFTLDAGWTISGGVATWGAGAAGKYLLKTLCLVTGKTYTLTYTVNSITGGTITPFFGTAGGAFGTGRTLPGTYTDIVTAANTSFGFIVTAGETIVIDNVTVREVNPLIWTPDGLYFNGVSNSLQSSSSINLTNTQKVTLLADVKINTYDLTKAQVLFETSVNAPANAGSMLHIIEGTTAGDPLGTNIYGNVGQNGVRFLPSLTKLTDNNVHQMIFLMDFTKGGTGVDREMKYAQDGQILGFSSPVSGSNNTDSFGNYPLFIGSRAGTSFWSEISVKDLVLLDTVLDSGVIADYYAWKKDIRNNSFMSLFGLDGKNGVPWLSVHHKKRKL